MPNRLLSSLLVFFLAFVGSSGAQDDRPATPVSAQEIVQRYIAARGGLEKIRAIRTLVLRGPTRENGKPGRQMLRARPFYLTIGGEGNDGSPWEAWDSYGLRARVSDAPAVAIRHTAYFDDPLIMSLDSGWRLELTGRELVDGKEAYRLRAVYPDGWVNELFVDPTSWLLVARRFTAPIHAFGEEATTQTLIGDYREVNGVLFPTRTAEYDLASGKLLGEGRWATIEANVPLPLDTFAPPPAPNTPVSRLVNAIFASRHITADALGWYHDFLSNPETANTDIEGAIESVAFQCLKNGAVPTGLALLTENLVAHPNSAKAHFGIGRAYRVAGREDDAQAEFREALRLDPAYQPAKDAMASARLKY